ncbi:MAG: phenylacetate--CoA ligase family protein [Theionarchaea archaeon]|nr:phenylacetate--CoA ligase family protein [Theionarchaea archaeon]MBU7034797.1 phenylacetate--CoA ligase family protein [Theionarchaea archaeon]MBU7040290.1 phenylacetate--CoA ligase family protein [Theionarchaea archaeon]
MKNQWKSPEELKKLQEKKVRSLLTYVYERNEFYHKLLRTNDLKPSDFETLDDLRKLPLLTKADMMDNYPHAIISRGFEISDCIHAATSGSTGQNLNLIYDTPTYEFYMAVTYRNFAALGYMPWHKLAYTRYESFKIENQFYEKLGLTRRLFISVFVPPEKQVAMLRAFGPDAVTAYPSILIEWAKMLKDKGKTVEIPVFIRSEAEILTREARSLIEEVFHSPIYEEYGSAEFVQFAWECKDRGFHISCDSLLLEFLDSEGEPVAPGEEGEIVVTSLEAHAMPFIRYRIRDRGVPLDDRCSCGRGLPLMKLVVGRDDDFIWLPSGDRVNPRMIIPYFELAPGVKEFRIVQERRDWIRVEIIAGSEFTEREQKKLMNELYTVIKDRDVEIQFDLCEEIPRGRHNRPRPILSKVRNSASSSG